jgi:hypothetical protein
MPMANAVVRGSLISAGLAGALFALAVQAAGDSFVVPGSKAAQLESCVEPTDFMRRNHMEVIKHQRDETVHNGIRSTKHSLAGCIECHVSYSADAAPVPVDEEGQFCTACHDFLAVGMNCFGCHATVPAYPEGADAGQATAGQDLGWHPPIAMSAPKSEGLKPGVSGEGNRP